MNSNGSMPLNTTTKVLAGLGVLKRNRQGYLRNTKGRLLSTTQNTRKANPKYKAPWEKNLNQNPISRRNSTSSIQTYASDPSEAIENWKGGKRRSRSRSRKTYRKKSRTVKC